MAKYNLTETKEKKATYRSLVSPQLMDELKDKILGHHSLPTEIQGRKGILQRNLPKT